MPTVSLNKYTAILGAVLLLFAFGCSEETNNGTQPDTDKYDFEKYDEIDYEEISLNDNEIISEEDVAADFIEEKPTEQELDETEVLDDNTNEYNEYIEEQDLVEYTDNADKEFLSEYEQEQENEEAPSNTYQIPIDACHQYPCASVVYPSLAAPKDYIVLGGWFPEVLVPWSVSITFGNGFSAPWFNTINLTAGAITVMVPEGAASGPITITFQNPPLTIQAPSVEIAQPNANGFFDCTPSDFTALGNSGSQPEEFGPYAVGWLDLQIYSTPNTMLDHARIHYPAQCFGNRKPPLVNAGPFPVLLWMHGDGFSLAQYEDFLQHLSSWGFVSVSFGSNRADEVRPAMQKIVSGEGVPQTIAHLFDFSKIFMGGHSMGGMASQIMADEFNSLVWISFAGKDATYEFINIDPSCPSILLGGTNDTQIPPDQSTHPIFERLNVVPKVHITIEGGNHGQFSDFGIRQATDSEASIPRSLQHYFINRYTIAFVRYVIYNETDLRSIFEETRNGVVIESVFEQ